MSYNDGIENEKQIEIHLDKHEYSQLNNNLKAFIYDVFNPTMYQIQSSIIKASRTGDSKFKPDLAVSYIGKQKYVSIKKGSGNSVHQESIESFVDYIKNELHADKSVIESLLFFHWGDGTIDGSAPVSCRMSAMELVQKYPEKITTIQNFFNLHKQELLERFLLKGIYNKTPVDIFYYGNCFIGDWHTAKEVIDSLYFSSGNALCIGGLNFQNYGRSLKGQDDQRRNSIQLKWVNMQSFFLVGSKSAPDIDSKVIGDNSHGFRNVTEMVVALNDILFCNISNNLKEFVSEIFDGKCNKDTLIKASKINRGKGDMFVWIDGNEATKKNISIISGSGNSVHQEKVSSFCSFLKEKACIIDKVIDEYLLFHFADGTINNTGSITSRMSASEYKKEHREELDFVEQSFLQSKKVIIEHFIKDNSSYDIQDVDYILYGNTELPYWAKIDTLIESECEKKPNRRAALAIGDFSIQAWNRSLEGNADYKRLDMQVKWNNLFNNIHKAQQIDRIKHKQRLTKHVKNSSENKAIDGLNYELKFASELNRNKLNPIWKILDVNDSQDYIVNVSYNQISKLGGAKIRAKSDCYVVRITQNIKKILEERNYVLTEEYLNQEHIEYEIVPHTGISIKMPSSKDYTLQKLSYPAFKNIFSSIPDFYFVASLLYVKETEIEKNNLILSTFNLSLESLCKALEINYNKEVLSTFNELKSKAITTIKEIVNHDSHIRNMICFGDDIFDPPYIADFIYESGSLVHRDAYVKDINVTTGSGRSSGCYTLAFK